MLEDIGFCFCFIATVCGTIKVKEVFPWHRLISFAENRFLYFYHNSMYMYVLQTYRTTQK